jgi:pyruvate dehydrogenase complex dihydrolipoamide acetyltransferase long form
VAFPIVIPQLGESVVEGTVAKWLKAEGDAVKLDEPIVEIATDKISIEIPAPAAGTLARILVREGTTLPVGTEIGTIAAAGESVAAAPAQGAPAQGTFAQAAGAGAAQNADASRASAGASQGTTGSEVAASESGPVPAGGEAPAGGKMEQHPTAAPAPALAGSPSASTSAQAAATMAPAQAPSDAPSGDGQGANGDREQSRTSPAVRRLAREHNIDLSRINGTGAGGRITKDDVMAFVERGGAAAEQATQTAAPPHAPTGAPAQAPAPSYASPQQPAAPAGAPPQPGALEEVVPMTTVRRTIAEQMARSMYTAPHVTTFDEVEMTAVADLRTRWKEQLTAKGVKLTYTPFFIKAATMALREWPLLNSSIVDGNIVYKKYYHIGVAVGADRGLIVPVIRDCDKKTIVDIARELEDLGARAHEGRVKMEEIRGSTFTVTNAGGFGAKSSTPIINYPEVAILGVHAVEKRPVVRNDEVVVRLMSTLAVSFDHRIIDGHIAVQFLRRICEFLEAPELMVVGA